MSVPGSRNGGSTAAEIVFKDVTKRYAGRPRPAVDSLSLVIPAGEICVLVGPSGAGKTTAMKMVNRLIDISEGDIEIDGRSVRQLDITELRRGIGYVIQQIGLFPHMSVGDNIAVVPRLLGWPKARPLMLMDEPFGALDPITRDRLQNEFLRLHREVRKTVIFVTHDIDEAIKLGDRIAILREGGVLAQYDTPDAILAAPADEFVARFVGADRGLKRLALRTLAEVELDSLDGGRSDGPRVPRQTTLRDALSLMLTEGTREVIVVGDRGEALGLLSFERVSDLLARR